MKRKKSMLSTRPATGCRKLSENLRVHRSPLSLTNKYNLRSRWHNTSVQGRQSPEPHQKPGIWTSAFGMCTGLISCTATTMFTLHLRALRSRAPVRLPRSDRGSRRCSLLFPVVGGCGCRREEVISGTVTHRIDRVQNYCFSVHAAYVVTATQHVTPTEPASSLERSLLPQQQHAHDPSAH
jgi:hypothetical protein